MRVSPTFMDRLQPNLSKKNSVACLSSVTYVLWLNDAIYRKKCLKKQIGNGLRESDGHLTDDVS